MSATAVSEYRPPEVVHSAALVPPETDLVMALGKNISFEWDRQRLQADPDHLSTESRMIADASGALHEPGRTLLFSGGYTIGEGYESTAEAYRRWVAAHYPAIPDDEMLLDETGADSELSAHHLAELVATGQFQHPALLTVGYHHAYTAPLFDHLGAPVDTFVAAEGILAERSESERLFIEAWLASAPIQRELEYGMEKASRILGNLSLGIDPLAEDRDRLSRRTVSSIGPGRILQERWFTEP